MIEYDEYELLELFESEPKLMGEPEIKMYDYKKSDDDGFTLNL